MIYKPDGLKTLKIIKNGEDLLEIRIKVEEEDEKPEKLRNLLNNGLKGKYILQFITQDAEKGEYIFRYKKR